MVYYIVVSHVMIISNKVSFEGKAADNETHNHRKVDSLNIKAPK